MKKKTVITLTILLSCFASYAHINVKPDFLNGDTLKTKETNNADPNSTWKIDFKNPTDRNMFFTGTLGQTWGLLIAAMDGSAQATHTRKVVIKGMGLGLICWTAAALTTSVMPVAIVYTAIYCPPVILYFIATKMKSQSNNERSKVSFFPTIEQNANQ